MIVFLIPVAAAIVMGVLVGIPAGLLARLARSNKKH
jgi:hypothetical protein